MTALSSALGIVLVVLVGWDIFLTVLHPSARGPVSYIANRASWALIRDLTTGLGVRRLLHWAGPLTMAVNVLVWALGLWLGYALIYLPSIEGFSYDQAESFGPKGLTEALYVSGVALTTVGFGDIVAATDLLRFATVLESWSGLVAITAAVTYVISVYPLVSSVRGSALRFSDLEAPTPRGAARLLASGEDRELLELQRTLIETHENIRRFPVLYYFHAPTVAESVDTLLRSAILVYLVSCCTVKPGPYGAGHYRDALRTTLLRVMDDFEADYIGGRTTRFENPPPLDRDQARERLRPLQEAAVEEDPEAATDMEGEERRSWLTSLPGSRPSSRACPPRTARRQTRLSRATPPQSEYPLGLRRGAGDREPPLRSQHDHHGDPHRPPGLRPFPHRRLMLGPRGRTAGTRPHVLMGRLLALGLRKLSILGGLHRTEV